MLDSSRTHGLYSPWNSPGHNTGVGSLFLLQGSFPTQRQNPVFPHCRWIWIPYQLSHQGNPSHQGSTMLICFSSTASNPSPSFAILLLLLLLLSHLVVVDSVRPHRRQPTRLPRPWDSPGKNTGVGCYFLLQCMRVKIESSSSYINYTSIILIFF